MLAVCGLLLVGCDRKAQDGVSLHSKAAGEHLGKAVTIAAESALKKLNELNQTSGEEAKVKARELAENSLNDLKKVKDPSPEIKAKMQELEVGLRDFNAKEKIAEIQTALTELSSKLKSQEKTENNNPSAKEIETLKAKLRELEKQLDKSEKR